jgi:hypothetical protein
MSNTEVAKNTCWTRPVQIAVVVGLGLGFFVAVPQAAQAVPDGATTGTVAVTTGIALTSLSPTFALAGIPGDTVESTAPVTYNVISNNPTGYTVTVTAAGATLPGVGTPANSIPIAALTIREGGVGPYTSLAAPVQIHAQGGISAAAPGDSLSSDFQMLIPNVPADTYTTTLTYLAADNA